MIDFEPLIRRDRQQWRLTLLMTYGVLLLLVVVVGCVEMRRTKTPAGPPPLPPLSPKIAAMMKTQTVSSVTAEALVGNAVTQPPAKQQMYLRWSASPDDVDGYDIWGSDYSCVQLTNHIRVLGATEVPDPGWLYIEMRAFSAIGESPMIVGQRVVVTRNRTTNTIRFVASQATRLEWTSNFVTWTKVRDVWGTSVTNVTHVTTQPKVFYRVRKL